MIVLLFLAKRLAYDSIERIISLGPNIVDTRHTLRAAIWSLLSALLSEAVFEESVEVRALGGSGFLIRGVSKRAANCFRTFSISSKRANLLGVASESFDGNPWPNIVDEEEPLPLNSVF